MLLLATLMNLAGPNLIVIFLIVLVLFGAKRLPDLARGMGQAMKEFQKANDDFRGGSSFFDVQFIDKGDSVRGASSRNGFHCRIALLRRYSST